MTQLTRMRTAKAIEVQPAILGLVQKRREAAGWERGVGRLRGEETREGSLYIKVEGWLWWSE